jgi:hypothetical protein
MNWDSRVGWAICCAPSVIYISLACHYIAQVQIGMINCKNLALSRNGVNSPSTAVTSVSVPYLYGS